jgi:hypothetical protein
MVFANLPKDTNILATLQEIKQRLAAVQWTIKVE